MSRHCVDPALSVIEEAVHHLHQYPPELKNLIQIMDQDLKFFKMFFWSLAYLEESARDYEHHALNTMMSGIKMTVNEFSMQSAADKGLVSESSEYEWRLGGVWSTMMCEFMKAADVFRKQFEHASGLEKITNWEPMSNHLREIIKQYKPLAKQICILLLNDGFSNKSCQSEIFILCYGEDTASFIDLILGNLQALHMCMDLIAPINQQLIFIETKLKLFGRFVCFAKDSSTGAKSLAKLISHTQTWANHISCLTCLYWVDEINEIQESDMGSRLSNLMQKCMPYTPEVISIYLDIFKAESYHECQKEVIPRLLVSFVDFLLENLHLPTRDNIENLHRGLIFLLSFVVDPPREYFEEKESISMEIYAIIDEVPSIICDLDLKLSGFLHKIDYVKLKVRELYVPTQHSSCFNSPETSAREFVNTLQANLRNMLEGEVDFISSIKDQLKIVLEELESLKPFLKVKDLWTQVMNVIYLAAHITKLCTSRSFFVWYGSICLPSIIEDINGVKSEVRRIVDDQTRSSKCLTAEMESGVNLLPALNSPKNEDEEAFIGFENDVQQILDHLVVGNRKSRTTISISGMAGQGKTSLAKKVYHHQLVQHHFTKTAWCYVSKECDTENLLANIVSQVKGADNGKLENDYSADRLRKCLKGEKYFIVLDDIWDVDVWEKVQNSFPNDKNGSRILFTSRNRDLATKAEPELITHNLRLFSDEESWQLMKYKLSHCDRFSEEILRIGKLISVYCKGLPLAVALIGSLLKKKGPVLDLWKKVAKDLKSHLNKEGCMPILELSYKHLPEPLKPCFLYFGAFPRGHNICAKKLKLIWIALRFVEGNGMQHSLDLASKHLDDLASQHLIVTERGSTGGIKSCKVRHDLLYDLCLDKAVQDKWLHLADENSILGDCHSNPQSAFSPQPLFNFFSCFKILTVLDLGALCLAMFPGVILSNNHLRYLALRGTFEDIPLLIVNLCNLETLIVKAGLSIVQLPSTLWTMKSLRYVNVDRSYPNLIGFVSNQCSEAVGCNIEVLGGIFLRYKLTQKEFSKIPSLRKLKFYCDDDVIDPTWFSIFECFEKLESLHGHYLGRHLLLNQQLPRLNFPNNLKKLTLTAFRQPWSTMSTIGELPHLEVLKLRYRACIGTAWHLGDGKFSSLKYLKLFEMDVERIDDSGCDDPLPYLEKLFLINCRRLKEIPFSFGHIYPLDTIDVTGSFQVSHSVRKILAGQRDIQNHDLRVFGLRSGEEDDDEMDQE